MAVCDFSPLAEESVLCFFLASGTTSIGVSFLDIEVLLFISAPKNAFFSSFHLHVSMDSVELRYLQPSLQTE